MKFCQILLLLLIAIGFFHSLYTDFNGVREKEPYGFAGAVGTVIVGLVLLLIYWKAGAFSLLLPS